MIETVPVSNMFCTKTHKAMNSDVYCNTPQSGTFQIGPVIYTRTLK
jgi:hypothetical protein